MVYLMILQRNSISSVVFLPKIPLQEESSEKPKLRNILQSNQSVFLKNVKVMKQILKNSVYRGDENANCGPWLDPGPEIEIVFGTKEIIKTIQSAQFSHSILSDSATPWIAARQASLSITNSRSSPKLMCIESVMPSSHLILCHPLLLLSPIPPSIRIFSNESILHMRWPKYWSFSLSISPSNEHPGLVSFRMDWLDLLAVQGTHNSSTLRFLHSPTLTSKHDH